MLWLWLDDKDCLEMECKKQSDSDVVVPVILSGGIGSRLWPSSRALRPKQLIALCSNNTMLQETAGRVTGGKFAAPVVICNEAHRFMIAQQLQDIGIKDAKIILEPVGRNTAPAVALAALVAKQHKPGAKILVLPSDHLIGNLESFHEAISVASQTADSGHLATFGIKPTRPEPGYGYIMVDKADAEAKASWQRISAFKEKTNRRGCRSIPGSRQLLLEQRNVPVPRRNVAGRIKSI